MKEYKVTVKELKNICPLLSAGNKVYLSGTVYTARDAAHKRFFELLEQNKTLPFETENAVVYYAGPTPTPQGLAIGSCGPTTSSRMDTYAPLLYDMGVTATIGKGERNSEVIDAIIRNKAVYLCAIGGAGALASMSITECNVIAFDDLGCESVKRLEFKDFPLIVGIDCNGGNIFKH
ncbi:MAG: FumA C-terminus/TtdB family hydratase beta subunit [Clostridia bacterium]|nr:FumA C-terminus/TtdB family hydratase beta subunit [Clostridia bacterium]